MATTVHRPELGTVANDLIDLVHREAPVGGGVPLLRLVELFGFELSPQICQAIEERGAVCFEPDGDGRGGSVNVGPAQTFKTPLVQLLLPATIRGRFVLSDDGFALSFEPGATIGLKKLLLQASIRSFELTRTRGALGINGPLPDIAFTW